MNKKPLLYIAIISFTVCLACLGLLYDFAFAGQIVRARLKNDLVDSKGQLTGGGLVRSSGATHISPDGLLIYGNGTEDQLIDTTTGQNPTDADSWWDTKQNITINSDGGFVGDGAGGLVRGINKTSVGMSANGTYQLIAKVKPSYVSWARLSIRDDDGVDSTYFNLSGSGSVGTDANDLSGISGPDSDGYYRIWIENTVGTVSSNDRVYVYSSNGNEDDGIDADGQILSYVKEIMLVELPSGNALGPDLVDQETLGSELVTNGTMEADSNWADATSPTVNEQSTTQVHSGTYSRKFTSDGANDGIKSDTFSVTAGNVYKVDAYVYPDDGTRVGFRIRNGGNSDWDFNSDSYSNPITQDAWNHVVFYYMATVTGAGSYFIVADTNADTGTFYVDDVSLKVVTTADKGVPDVATWPALAGAEAITAQNDRDFSSGNIGSWVVSASGSGTCTYDGTNPAGEKVAVVTSSSDTYAYCRLPAANNSPTASKLHRISANIYAPAANTLKNAQIYVTGFTGANPTPIATATLSNDTWTNVSGYVWIDSDNSGSLVIGFNGDPADGDILYIDDVSIRPIQISWVPSGTNTIELDETNDALKISYVDNAGGASLKMTDAADLSADMTDYNGQRMLLSGYFWCTGSAVEIKYYFHATTTSYVLTTLTAGAGRTYFNFVLPEKIYNGSDSLYFGAMGGTDVLYLDSLKVRSIPSLSILQPADYINSDTVPATPRFEADGLLVEGEATNLLEYSEDFSQWTDTNLTETFGSVTGPDGETCITCGMIADATATEARRNDYTVTSSLLDNGQYTFSVFAKSGTMGWIILLTGKKAGTTEGTYYHLSGNGTIGTDGASDSGIEALSDGWYKVWQSVDIETGATAPYLRIYATNSDNNLTAAANENDVVLYTYGAQLEETPYPTSYIPTLYGCIETRTSEAADGTYGYSWNMGTALQNALASGTIAGTAIAEITPQINAADGSGNINFIAVKAGLASISYSSNGTSFRSFDETNTASVNENLVSGTTFKVVTRWSDALDKFVVSDDQGSGSWEHGSEQSLDANGFTITGNKLYLGYGNEYPFHLKNLIIYDQYLTDAQVERMIWAGRIRGLNEMGLGIK